MTTRTTTPKALQARIDEFAALIHELARPLVHQLIAQNAAMQVIRSSSGMAMNYAAACVGRSHAEFTSKLGVALEESVETLKWLNYMSRCGLASPESLAGLIQEGSELVAIFRASYRTARGGYFGRSVRGRRPQ